MTDMFPEAGKRRLIFLIIAPIAAVAAYFTVFSGMGAVNRIFASLIVAVFFCIVGQSRANKYYSAEHNRLLDILYDDQDPDGFLAEYAPLAERCSPARTDYYIVNTYIANAYIAKGDFEKAEQQLAGIDASGLKKYSASAQSLVYNSLVNAYLMDGRIPEAERTVENIKALLEKTRATDPRTAASLQYNLHRFEGHLQYLKGEPVDNLKYFADEYDLAQTPVTKGAIGLLLAQIYTAEAERRIAAGETAEETAPQSAEPEQDGTETETAQPAAMGPEVPETAAGFAAKAREILEEIATYSDNLYTTSEAKKLLGEM